MKKQFVMIGSSMAILGAILLAANVVSAQETNENPLSSLAQQIAQKFGLNQGDVETVIQNFHQQRHDEMKQEVQAKMIEKLNQAVADGKLTDAQKQAILAKHAELQAKHEAKMQEFLNLSAEDRQTRKIELHDEMATERDGLRQWAQENGISDVDFLFSFGGKGAGRGELRQMKMRFRE